ncbi:hypothetical protein ACC692_38260, partial [Rhizobium ruizarguesonis]
MGDTYTVGQYLVDRLRELVLGHLFSVAGDYSIEWVNSYVFEHLKIRFPPADEVMRTVDGLF